MGGLREYIYPLPFFSHFSLSLPFLFNYHFHLLFNDHSHLSNYYSHLLSTIVTTRDVQADEEFLSHMVNNIGEIAIKLFYK
jgi:hypothetical protein